MLSRCTLLSLALLSSFHTGSVLSLTENEHEEFSSLLQIPPAQERPCWDNLTAIYEEDLQFQPYGSHNTYTICPGTYNIGKQYGQGMCCENGHYPLITRTNTKYKCGSDGSSKNGCVLVGGDTHVLINEVVFDDDRITNAVVEGFTFRSPERSTSFADAPGDVTFVDCIFEEQSNEGPILAFHESGRRRLEAKRALKRDTITSVNAVGLANLLNNKRFTLNLDGQDEQVDGGAHRLLRGEAATDTLIPTKMRLTFERCMFQKNTFAPPVDMFPTYGVVTAMSPDNVIVLEDCIFRDNVYPETVGYAVSASEGSSVSIRNTCFVNNEFNGYGMVQVYDNGQYAVEHNYGSSSNGQGGEVFCGFLAFSPTQPGNPTDVTCVAFDEPSCASAIVAELEA